MRSQKYWLCHICDNVTRRTGEERLQVQSVAVLCSLLLFSLFCRPWSPSSYPPPFLKSAPPTHPLPPPPPLLLPLHLNNNKVMVHSMAHLNIHHNHQLTHIDSPSSLAQLDHSLYSSTNSTISSMPQQMQQRYPQHPNDSFYTPTQPTIDVDALAAGVQRFIPGPTSSNSFIALTAGMDPSTVDFRTFYPYNPSEVKHRKRTTRSQLKILEDTFKRETKPNAALRKSLAAELEMTPRGVQVCRLIHPLLYFSDRSP